ncbi:MAG: 30S ribosomal protein S2 [Chitinophagales bacterium]|jgi:small subunit ribosomal protein S2|nr:30S ribosomal protein S2 [Chitinophagales bacterium]
MQKPTYKELLDAGCHFGHLRKKWNPKMTPYIFMEHKGIHLIDLNRTAECLERAAIAMKAMAKSGKKIMFVATKKQAREIVQKAAESVGMPFVTERWLGGMMTNFTTIRKSVKEMQRIDRVLNDTTITGLTKKERLMYSREHAKMVKHFGGIEQLNRLPSAVFIVDIHHEHLALAESRKLGVKTFGMVDTNSDPTLVDFAIPSNDDASKAISFITNYLANAIREGLEERKAMKGDDKESAEA